VAPVNLGLSPVYRMLVAGNPTGAARRVAERRTGLVMDEEDQEFLADLDVLYGFLRGKPHLSALGGLAARSEIIRRMETRLSVRRLLRDDPSIASVPVRAPIIVTGLPRTATTLVHRLLASSVTTRAPMLWEVLHPASGPGDQSKNLRTARWLARMYHLTVPATRDIHPTAATSPEECTFLLPQTLMYEMMGPMPGYRRWYGGRDVTGDYRYLRAQLQVLQRRGPRRRWVLKSPFHLANLDVLLDTFPDATIVWTSRDPAVALASWCSLIEANMAMYNDRVDPVEIGITWLPIWQSALQRARATRRRRPDRFLDVEHAAVMADPVGTTTGLWRQLGVEYDDQSRRALSEEARQDGRRNPGAHRYALERYGLGADDVRAALNGLRRD
jgi:hypothetical protein